MICHFLPYTNPSARKEFIIKSLVESNRIDLLKYFITVPLYSDKRLYGQALINAVSRKYENMVQFIINIPNINIGIKYNHGVDWAIHFSQINIVKRFLDQPDIFEYIKENKDRIIRDIQTNRGKFVDNTEIIELLKSVD
jgi:hypothetical protein